MSSSHSAPVPLIQPSAAAGNSSAISPPPLLPQSQTRSSLPTAKQALSKVYTEDDSKRAGHTSRPPHPHPRQRHGHGHRHTHSLGLLSPTPSTYASSSSSLISDVPRSSASASSRSFASSPSASQHNLNLNLSPNLGLPTKKKGGLEATTTTPTTAQRQRQGAISPGAAGAPGRSHTSPTPLSSVSPRPRSPPVRSPSTPTPTSRASNPHSNPHSRGHTQTHTPTPTRSPLVRKLLQPLGLFSAPSTPTTSVTPLSSSPLLSVPHTQTHTPTYSHSHSSSPLSPLHMAAIHHPAPQASSSAYQPPSPTTTHHSISLNTNTVYRPPSRSEKLLRDALLKDEMERHGGGLVPPLPNSPLAASSFASTSTSAAASSPASPPSGRGHKRRHSHIPTSSNALGSSPAPAMPTSPSTPSRMQDSEDYIRASSMFRTAMSNPRSVSPPLRGFLAHHQGGRHAQPHQGSPYQHQQHQQQGSEPQAHPQSPHTPRRHANEPLAASGTGRSTSHSPSPLGRRAYPAQAQGATTTTTTGTMNTGASMSRTPTSPRSPPAVLQRHHTVHASSPMSSSASPPQMQHTQSPSTSGGRQRSTTTSGGGVRGKSRPPPIDLFNSSSSSSAEQQQQQQRQVHQAYQRVQGQLPAYASPAPGSSFATAGSGRIQGPGQGGEASPPASPPMPGQPLLMTPHEQVLRARLERVLEQGRVVEKREREREERRKSRERERSMSGSRSASSRRGGNEVRDEEGGWPWRERERGAASVVSSGQYSSPSSGSGGSKQGQSAFFNAFAQAQAQGLQPPRTPSAMHKRTRSKTDPVSPPPASRSAAPSPRRSSTAPAPAYIGGGTPSKRQHPTTGTTPPLTLEGEVGGEEVEEEDGELRLLTPPPTPPFTARIFSLSTPQRERGEAHLSGAHGRAVTMGGEYVPSPYKLPPQQQHQQLGKKGLSGLGLGLPPPSARRRNSSEEDDASSSCSSHHRSNNSQASFPSSRSSNSNVPLETPLSPPVNRLASPPRPSFNARKASVQCRAMQGYVSFASVEGLGEPPRGLNGDDVEGEEGNDASEKRGREKERGVLGGWSGWKKLLGVAVAGSAGAGAGEGNPGKEGVVL